MSDAGRKIIEALEDAVRGNYARVHLIGDKGEQVTFCRETPLIAAAPELLEALKDCAADLEARIEHAFNEIGRHPAMRRDYEADISTVKAARAAIAKATSRRP